MRNEREKYREQEGFTLVELICVIAIMGILMAIAVPSYNHFQERSAKQVAIANARSNYVQGKAQQEHDKRTNDHLASILLSVIF